MPNKNKTHAIRRGCIYHINDGNGSKPTGCEIWPDRPGLVISNDALNAKNKGVVEIVYLTLSPSKGRYREHVPIHSAGRKAVALCDQIHTVYKSRLGALLGAICPSEQEKIDEALLFNLFPKYAMSNMAASDAEIELTRYKEGYERLEAMLLSIQQLTALKETEPI